MASLMDDPRLEHGRQLVREKKVDEAVDFFTELAQVLEGEMGQFVPALAPLYYETGNALLLKVENDASLLAATGAAPSGGSSSGAAGGSSSGAASGAAAAPETDAEPEAPEEDTEEDPDSLQALLEDSWMWLDGARVLFTRGLEESGAEGPEADRARRVLSTVCSRLGDHSVETGNFEAALADYRQCLELRRALLGDAHRFVADAHYSIALLRLQTLGHCQPDEVEALRRDARDQFRAAQAALQRHALRLLVATGAGAADTAPEAVVAVYRASPAAAADPAPTEGDAGELAELVSVLEDMAEQVADSERALAETETTTVGFGSGSGSGSTTVGFGSGSGSGSASAGASAAPVMLMARKKPSAGGAAAAAASAGEASAAGGSAAEKRKDVTGDSETSPPKRVALQP